MQTENRHPVKVSVRYDVLALRWQPSWPPRVIKRVSKSPWERSDLDPCPLLVVSLSACPRQGSLHLSKLELAISLLQTGSVLSLFPSGAGCWGAPGMKALGCLATGITGRSQHATQMPLISLSSAYLGIAAFQGQGCEGTELEAPLTTRMGGHL